MASGLVKNSVTLSRGALKRILVGNHEQNIVLQILGYKEIPGNRSFRFRVVLNDGETVFANAVLDASLNRLISEKSLEKYSVFMLKGYGFNQTDTGTRVIVCADIEIISAGSEINRKIENDVSVSGIKKGPSVNELNCTLDSLPQCQNISAASTSRASNVAETMNSCKSAPNPYKDQNIQVINTCSNLKTSDDVTLKTSGLAQNNNYSFTQSIDITSASKTNVNETLNTSKSAQNHIKNPSVQSITKTSPSRTLDIKTLCTSTPVQRDNNSNSCSIKDITPYYNKWLIKAYVYYKAPINSYSSSRGQGKYFAFYLKDDSGEIRVTAFNGNAERIFESIQLYNTYLISKATVKIASENASYQGDYELIIEDNTQIVPLQETLTSLPSSLFNFHTIEEIRLLPKETYTDVIGMCMAVYDLRTIYTKLNKEALKLDLILFDRSNHSITVALWNSQAKNHKIKRGQIIVLKNAKVASYGLGINDNSCSLCVDPTSMVYIEPAMEEVDSFKTWYNSLPPSPVSQVNSYDLRHQPISRSWKSFKEISSDDNSIKWPLYYKTKATIVMVNKERCLYQACPVPGCMKKVIESSDGTYKCNKCNKNFITFNWTIFLNLELGDITGSLWTVAFNETAENLIGMSAVELSKIKEEDREKYSDVLSGLNLKSYIFDLRSDLDTFNAEVKVKTTISNYHPINLNVHSYTKRLLTDIERFGKILSN